MSHTQTQAVSYIRTRSGKKFYPFYPSSDAILIEDIASGLSKECRFIGQCNDHYSVAEHSIEVSKLVPKHLALAALLHDGSEAYCRDLPPQIKCSLPDYGRLENDVQNAINSKFEIQIGHDDYRHIKSADNFMIRVEFLRFYGLAAYLEDFGQQPTHDILSFKKYLGMYYQLAELEFLTRYNQIVNNLH